MAELPESDLLAGSPVGAGSSGGPDHSSPVERPWGARPRRSREFDSLVEETRRWYGWDRAALPYLVDRIRRRLGVAPVSPAAAALGAVVGVGLRLAIVVLATALVGEWADLPWGRWALILACYAVFDAGRPYIGPPVDVPVGPRIKTIVERWTALLPTIMHESDLRDLSDYVRRSNRLQVAASMGLATAVIMLSGCWWLAPEALRELPVGSVVLLIWLLFDFGATVIHGGVVFEMRFVAREARYDHHLFWPSPADTPEVQQAMRKVTSQGSATGFWITVVLLLTVVLVSWDSPLVVPLGAGFIIVGYFALFGAALGNRASIHRIVQRVREKRLRGLQERIDGFGSSYTDLSPQEFQELRELLFLHDKIRDAPTTPTTTRTVMHTAVGLIIPTILFIVTVFGEVYAERVFDTILP